MKVLHSIAFVLVVVGGLNWLLVGLFGWDVGMIFGGQGALVSIIIYILVGLSAIYLIFSPCKCCNVEEKKAETPVAPTQPQM